MPGQRRSPPAWWRMGIGGGGGGGSGKEERVVAGWRRTLVEVVDGVAGLEVWGRTDRRRRTASASRPSQGEVVLEGVGRFRCCWRKAGGGGLVVAGLEVWGRTGRRRRTASASRLSQGEVVLEGVGRFRCCWRKAGGGGLVAEGLEAWGRTGRRRRTASANCPSQGRVVLDGVGRFRCCWRKAGCRGGSVEPGGDHFCGLTTLGGCSCTTSLASCPERGGVARSGSGQLRGVGEEEGRVGRWRGGGGGQVAGRGVEGRWALAVVEGRREEGQQQGLVGGGTGRAAVDAWRFGPSCDGSEPRRSGEEKARCSGGWETLEVGVGARRKAKCSAGEKRITLGLQGRSSR